MSKFKTPLPPALRFKRAKEITETTSATMGEAFTLLSGGKVNGSDLETYLNYWDTVNESPYLLGRPCAAFDD